MYYSNVIKKFLNKVYIQSYSSCKERELVTEWLSSRGKSHKVLRRSNNVINDFFVEISITYV